MMVTGTFTEIWNKQSSTKIFNLKIFLSRFKNFETITESFPQLFLNLFVIHHLQIREWYSIFSAITSVISVVYGLSEMLTMVSYGNSNFNIIPFKKTVLAMSSIVIDISLRILSLVFLSSFFPSLSNNIRLNSRDFGRAGWYSLCWFV